MSGGYYSAPKVKMGKTDYCLPNLFQISYLDKGYIDGKPLLRKIGKLIDIFTIFGSHGNEKIHLFSQKKLALQKP